MLWGFLLLLPVYRNKSLIRGSNRDTKFLHFILLFPPTGGHLVHRDDHALSESGPALQLSPLTAEDSGNYTCGLRTNSKTRSRPYELHVEAAEEGLFFTSVFLIGLFTVNNCIMFISCLFH
ncbi:sialic acid-binding Ig-like lectin 16 [Lates japonicus]|uniref:Sialic acid-binding Ig-like lectin 16 n=1 Tax=Lates japonicus TaxID=270547 RepID=A0AAD3RHK8_LATJO|nr:sialic acid-binding Ig-like lectin 16 [Lates japonicus]